MEARFEIEPGLGQRSRTANVAAWLVYAFFFLFLWLLIPAIVRIFSDKVWIFSRVSSKIALWCFGIKIEIRNNHQADIRRHARVIYFSNHSSWFDQVALCVALGDRLCFLANEKYFRMPLLSWAMRLYDHIPVLPLAGVERKRQEADEIRAKLNQGRAIVVFPEGTRSGATERDLLPFKKGIFSIAAQEGAAVVPVLICGAKEVYPKGCSLLAVKRGTIRLLVDLPVLLERERWLEQSIALEEKFRLSYRSFADEVVLASK